MKAATATAQPATGPAALDSLVSREEVLQIAYWYQGEGFGDSFDTAALGVFLNCDRDTVELALSELVARGNLEPSPDGRFQFTRRGKQASARLFAEGFADYQKASHGECIDGCCDDDDHSQCGEACAHD